MSFVPVHRADQRGRVDAQPEAEDQTAGRPFPGGEVPERARLVVQATRAIFEEVQNGRLVLHAEPPLGFLARLRENPALVARTMLPPRSS